MRVLPDECLPFLTVDRRLPREREFATLRIAVIVLAARSNRHLDLLPLVPAILDILPRAKPGAAVVVGD